MRVIFQPTRRSRNTSGCVCPIRRAWLRPHLFVSSGSCESASESGKDKRYPNEFASTWILAEKKCTVGEPEYWREERPESNSSERYSSKFFKLNRPGFCVRSSTILRGSRDAKNIAVHR